MRDISNKRKQVKNNGKYLITNIEDYVDSIKASVEIENDSNINISRVCSFDEFIWGEI